MSKMQGTSGTTDTVFQMRFPQKLWHLLSLGSDAILWSGNGETILLNYKILHGYLQTDRSIFKTTNISSFIRQLNLYGFRKVTSHLQDPLCNSSNPFMHEYMHDYFQYGRPDLLKKISRKPLNIKSSLKTKRCHIQEQNLFSPLQKARHALRIALNKVIENYYLNKYADNKYEIEFEDAGELCENDATINMFIPKKDELNPEAGSLRNIIYENEYSLCNYSSNGQPNHSEGILCMPHIEAISCQDLGKMELLTEFNVNKNTSSLNCILPSLEIYNMYDHAVNENHNENYFHGDWEQMLNDINANKNSFCSQISMANDVLNS